ncbi:MAG TPA: ECF-type sigma factor [Bryobacteraceae bacterium]|nr:ECF-type sigma factor [Bryobacteraceae bacterium]
MLGTVAMRTQNSEPPEFPEWRGEFVPGGREELNLLFSAAYEELRRLAGRIREADPHATLSPTTLVNEAWLKMANAGGLRWESPLHFKRIAAQAMRQLLVTAARRRGALKRASLLVTFDEELPAAAPEGCGLDEVVRLDAALGELAKMSPRQAQIVECRFFGGLEVGETAETLGISEATVARDWRVAKAWLSRELGQG